MNTWISCERDAIVTGKGAIQLDGYSFLHQVYGQIPAVTTVLQPKGIGSQLGFAKRFTIGFFGQARTDTDQQCTTSKELLFDFHNWMGEHASTISQHPYLDSFAVTLFDAIQLSVKQFQDETQDLDELFAQKLGFIDTDILRFTNVCRRMVQFPEQRATLGRDAPPSSR